MKNSASSLCNDPTTERDGDLKHVLAVLKVCHEYNGAPGVRICSMIMPPRTKSGYLRIDNREIVIAGFIQK
jgi:hypothetical protein